MNAAVPILATIGGSLVVFLLCVLIKYVPIIERNAFDIPRHRLPPKGSMPPSLACEEHGIPFGKSKLRARFIRFSQAPAQKAVVFCHETGADWQSWSKHADFLPREGVAVITFDYGTDQKSFQWPRKKEIEAARAVVAWAAGQKKIPRIALFGVSKGSIIAAGAAHHPAVRAVVMDGAFSSYSTLESYMKRWAEIYVPTHAIARAIPAWVYAALSRITLFYAGLRNREHFLTAETLIKSLRKPVFMIHAEKDPFAKLEHVECLRLQIGKTADLWTVPGAGHSDSVIQQPREYHKKISEFLHRHLA